MTLHFVARGIGFQIFGKCCAGQTRFGNVMKKNENGQWQKPEPVEGELNSEVEEGIVSFSPDGTTMYLNSL